MNKKDYENDDREQENEEFMKEGGERGGGGLKIGGKIEIET